MLDKLLEIGSAFDWISPMGSLIGNVLNGPSHTFLIPINDSPMTGREIARMLKRRGVHSWGHMIVRGTLMVSVRQSQAGWAQHLLGQAGIPLESHDCGEEAHGSPQTSPQPKKGREAGGLNEAVREFLDYRLF